MNKGVYLLLFILLPQIIVASNLPPVAVLSVTPDRTWFYNAEEVVFDYYDSYDPEYYIVDRRWYINGVLQGPNTYEYSKCFVLYGNPVGDCYELPQGETTVDLKLGVKDVEGVWDYDTKTYTIQQHKGRKYFVKDHLGNIRTTVNRDGNVLGHDDYYPFGLTMLGRSSNSANPNDNYKYIGEELDDEAGLTLMNLNARMYDPITGRFNQIDPLFDHPAQLGLSPYNYSWNNPINLSDPTGECPLCWAVAGAVWVGAEIGLAAYDIYDVVTTLSNENATTTQKVVSVGGATAGLLLPGGGYSAADNVAEGGTKLISRFSSKSANEASGLIGKEFEQFLGKNLDGVTNVKYSGREFDVETATSLIEAKSGGFWDLVSGNSDKLNNFKSTIGQQSKIASENGKSFELVSNTKIPNDIKDWLTDKGINFTELLDN